MMPAKKRLLVVDDERAIAEIVSETLVDAGFDVETAYSANDALAKLANNAFDAVVSDIHMPGKSGLRMMEEAAARNANLPPFLFVSANADPVMIERASKFGAVDVIQKPFRVEDVVASVKRLLARSNDRMVDIMAMIRGISGMTLGNEKRAVVETRLLRRTRQLGLDSLDEYFQYFTSHREKEIAELVSIITTHTTDFFRESAHFDYLADEVFPSLIANGSKEIKIWSAASSSGEEVYSIAMCWLEFLRSRNIAANDAPRLEVLGTDIDFHMIEAASKGIYHVEKLARIDPAIVNRYFDRGSGDIAQFVRVKDPVFQLCKFSQMNLIGSAYPSQHFDVIFLRNVLIYFKPDVVREIARKLEKKLQPGGLLFLGHSESVSGMGLSLEIIGNSIYRTTRSSPTVVGRARQSSPGKDSVKKVRVYIIDDSATIRAMLKKVFAADEKFVVVGEAENPTLITKPLTLADVDVVTLDIHMPGQDGVSYLKSIQGRDHPPVVMVSSVSYEDGVDYFSCLELGAVDYLEKPSSGNLTDEAEKVRRVVASAAGKHRQKFGYLRPSTPAATLAPVYRPRPGARDLILIGASTGGVEALKVVLEALPPETPPILIVQHIPEKFSRTLAERLDRACKIAVVEAVHDQWVEPNTAYIAPGGRQMAVVSTSGRLKIAISDAPPVNRHRPSVDFLFDSACSLVGHYQTTAALLTGMGADGAKGLLNLKGAGAHTIAQDEDTCIVYGMPKAAAEIGAALEILPLPSIPYHLVKPFRAQQAPPRRSA